MYASSDVNIVMMMFFELFVLRKISEFPSETLSKNSSKNIIITIEVTYAGFFKNPIWNMI